MIDDDDIRTVWVGNLSNKTTEEILYELFLQAAPLQRVKIPKDKDGKQCNYGFVTFKHQSSVPYSVELLNGIELFDQPLNIKPRNSNQNNNQQHMRIVQELQSLSSQISPLSRVSYSSMEPHNFNQSDYYNRKRTNDSPYGRPHKSHFRDQNRHDRHSDWYYNNSNRRDFGRRNHSYY